MLTNKPIGRDEAAKAFRENAVEQVIAGIPNVGKIYRFSHEGRFLTVLENVEVRGSDRRDVNKMEPVYRDARGRYTLEPLGRAVGVLLRGGTNQRLCHIGLYDEVSRAADH